MARARAVDRNGLGDRLLLLLRVVPDALAEGFRGEDHFRTVRGGGHQDLSPVDCRRVHRGLPVIHGLAELPQEALHTGGVLDDGVCRRGLEAADAGEPHCVCCGREQELQRQRRWPRRFNDEAVRRPVDALAGPAAQDADGKGRVHLGGPRLQQEIVVQGVGPAQSLLLMLLNLLHPAEDVLLAGGVLHGQGLVLLVLQSLQEHMPQLPTLKITYQQLRLANRRPKIVLGLASRDRRDNRVVEVGPVEHVPLVAQRAVGEDRVHRLPHEGVVQPPLALHEDRPGVAGDGPLDRGLREHAVQGLVGDGLLVGHRIE
mmetsp:Transcript_57503/g.102727  ORF Transcript_57503/g.102727 Transcript_57503/m.102727 type:complete len:315 (+) Transcript_57503:251-1195(+)